MLRYTYIARLDMINKTNSTINRLTRKCKPQFNSVLQSLYYSFISGVLNGSVISSEFAAACGRKIGG